MEVDSRQKRSRLGNQRFLFSIFYTFFFLSLYLLGLYYIPAPESYLGQLGKIPERKLLSWILDYQIQINSVVSVLSTLFATVSGIFWMKQEVGERQSLEVVWSTLSRFLKPNVIAFAGVFKYWDLIKNSPYLVFLTYLSFFVSNSVFELIVEFLNDYGVCRGFNLIFFIDKFPLRTARELFTSLFKIVLFTGSYSDLERSFLLLLTSVIIYLFISLSNEKWEVPINTNRIGYDENHINYSPTFLLQTDFSVFPLIFISNLIKMSGILCHLLLKSLQKPLGFSFTGEFFALWENFNRFSIESSSFKEVFFAINNAANPFSNFYQRGMKNTNFLLATAYWILIIHFTNWLFISNSQLNSREISEKLEKSGAYLDKARPGKETRKLVGRAINTLVASWAFYLTLFAICFDNIVSILMSNSLQKPEHYNLSFLSLLITVSTATDLSKQIRKKYSRSKFYD